MADVVGLFLRSVENAYQRQLWAAATHECKRHGFELRVQSVQFDSSQQVAQIREAIQSAATTNLIAILVSGVRDADLIPVAYEAAAAGLDWALLNDGTYVEEIRQRHPNRAVFTAAGDQVQIGQVQAELVRALLGESGRVMCVTGNLRNIEAHRRLDGLKQGLGDAFEIVEVNADWTSEGARRAVERWGVGVATKELVPAAFVAQNDEMALGVRQALRDIDLQREWPIGLSPIVGCDGAEDFGQRLVRHQRLTATVVMTPGSGAAIDWIARARGGGDLPPAHVVMPAIAFPALSRLRS